MFLKYNLPALLWATAILFLTLLPADSLPQVPEWELFSFYTASHAAVFFLLAVLLRWGFSRQTRYGVLQRRATLSTFLFSVLFGAGIECLQTLMGLGRQGDPMDVLSNTIGTALGLLFYAFLLRQPRFREHL